MESTEEVKSSKRKDFLVSIEKEMQVQWENDKIYEANAPAEFNPDNYEIESKN